MEILKETIRTEDIIFGLSINAGTMLHILAYKGDEIISDDEWQSRAHASRAIRDQIEAVLKMLAVRDAISMDTYLEQLRSIEDKYWNAYGESRRVFYERQ